MQYRLFEPGDFDNLYAIEEICFQLSQRFTRRYMRELIASPGAATWVAVEQRDTQTELPNNRSFSPDWLTGFAILECTEQISGTLAYIATIEVLPEYRGRGIGAELMRRLEDSAIARRAIAIWLHVDAENATAIRLYERMGYRNSGRADHFYARNRPAAIYVKHLD